ncbi:hypothetical protein [Maribacter sp. 4G9]|uniref:hypothetical protein n=1 Tax=Maribacter sp. 4G9 TaxID=1889777 RepID=UPI000C15E8A1|nr:hypothetical protein [Maribacter sp. 4G9]PIB39312.1 hypothetical protein BFP75_12050 [Maribacter sp. 4G9]
MKEKLREDLIRMSTDIITSREVKDITGLYEAAKKLYEKIAVLKFIEEELNDIQVDVSKNVIAEKFEKMAKAVMSANTSVPESNPHEEDIMTPGMDTIKDMVSEMPNSDSLEEVLTEFMARPDLMKNDKELFMPPASTKKQDIPKSLNDSLVTKELKVDLNSKLGFIKHLFHGSTEDYNRVLSQLSTIDSHERSISFIKNMVKPDYDNWEGKEEYEIRFMELIERRFS